MLLGNGSVACERRRKIHVHLRSQATRTAETDKLSEMELRSLPTRTSQNARFMKCRDSDYSVSEIKLTHHNYVCRGFLFTLVIVIVVINFIFVFTSLLRSILKH